MPDRPHVTLSCAMSLDGHLDDTTPERLVLSSAQDLDAVDALRAGCDAILVGAETVRRDDPRLLVRDAARRRDRESRGLPPSPLRATLTASGDLDPGAAVFTEGDGERVVYVAGPANAAVRQRFSAVASVVEVAPDDPVQALLADLVARGVGRLLVEGGGRVLAAFLEAGAVDELRVAIAPVFLALSGGPRAFDVGETRWTTSSPAVLRSVEDVGGTAVLVYDLGRRDTEETR